MRIGELSKRTSVSRDTIRFYERNGLIKSRPSASATNSYRDYSEDAELTLELIREAQAAGFTLEELRRFIAQLEASPSDGFDGEAFLEQKIREVKQKIRRSKRFLRTLRMTKQALAVRP
jgi:DNA-binding transcriptional MerR regulator